jgi:hypothetical protein
MKYCTVNIARWGTISPCYKIEADGANERVNVWKCKINSNGNIVSSKLIQNGLYSIDQVNSNKLHTLFLDEYSAKQFAINKLN